MKNRYAVFAFDGYYPSGGWDDLYGRYDDDLKAESYARAQLAYFDHTQIVDLQTGKKLKELSRDHEPGALA